MPVRGGVLDAPRSCDSRAALDAFVWRGRPHPRHPRCARHRPQPNVCNPAGAARAPFHTGEPKLSANPRRAGVEARPYDGLGRFTGNVFASHPRRRNPSVTALRAATAPLSGEPRGGVRFKHLVRSPTPDGRERAKKDRSADRSFFTLKCPRAFQTDSISLV